MTIFKRTSIWTSRVRSDIERYGASRRVGDRIRWDLERFGITPRGIAARVRASDGPGLVCNSLPKAGTHLVERALCLHPGVHRRLVPTLYPYNLPQWGELGSLVERQRPGQLLVTHLPFERSYLDVIEAAGARAFFVIRDPRDVVVSNAFYIAASSFHNWHRLIAAEPTIEARIRVLIEGREATPRIPSIAEYLERYAGWLDGGALVVRFEDLVGAPERRLQTLDAIYRHAGLGVEPAELERLAGKLISPASPTYRSGATGEWRKHFDSELEARFTETAGRHLARYGYAEDGARPIGSTPAPAPA